MKLEIYGIPEEVGRCYGCRRVRGLLDALNVEYIFYPVMQNSPDGIVYDRPLIESLAKRLKQKGLGIGYPVIFSGDSRVKNFNELKDLLLQNGADEIIIEDFS